MSGFKVEAILIEELADIQHEYYCSVALDASGRQFYLIASAEGGIDIEEVAATNPDAIIKENFSFKHGLDQNMAESVAKRLDFISKVIGLIVLFVLAITAFVKKEITTLIWIAVIVDLLVRTLLDALALFVEKKLR